MIARLVGRKKEAGSYGGPEQRKHGRTSFQQPLRFKTLGNTCKDKIQPARAWNVSQGGIRFRTVTPPSRKSHVLIQANRDALSGLIKMDRHLTLAGEHILGQVVWTHLNLNNGLFEVGVRFVHPTEHSVKEFRALAQS